MGAKVQEDDLLKAIADIEDQLAKGSGDTKMDGQPSMPTSTAEANGALGQEGDKSQLAQKSAQALEAYVAKSMDDDEEDDDDEDDDMDKSSASSRDDDEDDEDESWSRNRARKSERQLDLLKSNLSDGEGDLMPFLESLVNQVSEGEEAMTKSLRKLRSGQEAFNETLAKAVVANCQMVVSIKKSLDSFLAQPNGQRKSYLSKSEISQRFGNQDGEQPQFNRQDIKKALVELTAARQINGLAVTTFETHNYLDPQVKKAVEQHLQKSA